MILFVKNSADMIDVCVNMDKEFVANCQTIFLNSLNLLVL